MSRTNTLVITRGVESSITLPVDVNAEATQEEEQSCIYDGGTLVFSHPLSLRETDKHFKVGRISLHGYVMMIDKINAPPKCGLEVQGKRYAIELRSYGDDNDARKSEAISRFVAPNTDFFLSPYGSGLTEGVSLVANETGKVMVAANSNRASVYDGRPASFSVTMIATNYVRNVIPMLSAAGAKSVHVITEEGTQYCDSLPAMVPGYGMILQGESSMGKSPKVDDFFPIAKNMSKPENDPDVVVTCVYGDTCKEWVFAMRKANWSPRAQVLTVCVGSDAFNEAVGTDAEHMIGTTPWDKGLPAKEQFSGETAAYQAAMAAGSVSVLTQAIEQANSFKTTNVAYILANSSFTTLYGEVQFNEIGINSEVHLLVQLDEEFQPRIVYPVQPEYALVYPMPTWAQRDCLNLSPCGSTVSSTAALSTPYAGTCDADGTCGCKGGQVSVGIGQSAACHSVPEVDMNYIPNSLLIMGYLFFGISALTSIFFFCWTTYFRGRSIIKKSQPIFLHLVNLGCLVIALAIIPSGIQGGYDPVFGTSTEVSNNLHNVDAACMATPWLFGLGFSLTFSALFAKVWRIRKIFTNAQSFLRVQVKPMDVMKVMVGVLGVEIIVLLVWQLVDPLVWVRTVTLKSDLGYAVESVGTCQNGNASPYVTVLGVFNLGILMYSLWLCYATRTLPSEFNESKWITASVISIFQLMILGIPVMVIVRDNPSANYCVRVCVFFLMSMSTMFFIYAPKFAKMHIVRESEENAPRRQTEIERIRLRVSSTAPVVTIRSSIQEEMPTEKEPTDESPSNSGDFTEQA
ncbi:hypothetical protein ACHAXR_006348 [Thalassiosira sp. AJA248-18]